VKSDLPVQFIDISPDTQSPFRQQQHFDKAPVSDFSKKRSSFDNSSIDPPAKAAKTVSSSSDSKKKEHHHK
jgi:hypothetical protein